METPSAKPKFAYNEIPIDQIIVDREESLRGGEMDKEKLKGLQNSIENIAMMQAVQVLYDVRSRTYKLITGERRYEATKRLNVKTIPAKIYDNLSDKQILLMRLTENMQREDLTPLQEARGMADLRDLYRYSVDAIAKELGKSEEFVRERLALLTLPPPIRKKLAEGSIGVTHAEKLTKLNSKPDKQMEIAEDAEVRKLSADIVDRMVERVLDKTTSRKKKTRRRYWVKKNGEQLSEGFMDAKIDTIAAAGDEFIETLAALPLRRWSPEASERLQKVLELIEKKIAWHKNRVGKRAKQAKMEKVEE